MMKSGRRLVIDFLISMGTAGWLLYLSCTVFYINSKIDELRVRKMGK